MAFRDPFAVYTAVNNYEADWVCGLLIEAGIEAMVIEDLTSVASGWLGPLPGIYKPQVWIERADLERARPILEDHERKAAERLARERDEVDPDAPHIEVKCEDCGKCSEYPATKKGSIGTCPHCGAYVDVGEVENIEGWDQPLDDESSGEREA